MAEFTPATHSGVLFVYMDRPIDPADLSDGVIVKLNFTFNDLKRVKDKEMKFAMRDNDGAIHYYACSSDDYGFSFDLGGNLIIAAAPKDNDANTHEWVFAED